MNCKDCKFFSAPEDRYKHPDFGDCKSEKFHKTYWEGPPEIKSDEVIVEPDEGWGFIVGEDFGCIHFLRKR